MLNFVFGILYILSYLLYVIIDDVVFILVYKEILRRWSYLFIEVVLYKNLEKGEINVSGVGFNICFINEEVFELGFFENGWEFYKYIWRLV